MFLWGIPVTVLKRWINKISVSGALILMTRSGCNWLRIVSHDRRRVLAVNQNLFSTSTLKISQLLACYEVSFIEDNEAYSICHESRKKGE
jgi:hypothetical protein